MRFGRITRFGAGVAASAMLAGGAAVATAGTAAAADGYEGPELSTEQGDVDGGNLTLELTNPNVYGGFLQGSACTSALLDGEKGLNALVAYNAGDYAELLSILTSPGVTLGPAASNTFADHGPNSASKTVDVDDGVYIYVGTCGGLESINPENIGVSVQPVIVPGGLGSLAPASAFGSLLLESGDAISALSSDGLLDGLVGAGS